MTLLFRVLAITYMTVVLVPSFMRGQVHPYDPKEGFLSGVRFPASQIATDCALPLLPTSPEITRSLTCDVLNASVIDTSYGMQWGLVRYRRLAVETYDEFIDTLAIDEILLYEQRENADSVTLVWHVARVRTFEFIDHVDWIRRDEGFLLRITFCLNGTGGCYEHFLLRTADGWHVLEMTFLDEMKKYLPDGFRIHKGRQLDLRTLRGIQPISAPGDANCCPSGLVEFSLSLDGGDLRLREARVVKPRND